MLLVSVNIVGEEDSGEVSDLSAADVQDEALQMFPEATGITVPVTRRSMQDTHFHGSVMNNYKHYHCEKRKESAEYSP